MCERCIEQAAQIDAEFLKLMQELEPEYRALEAKAGPRIREIFKMTLVDEEGEIDTDDIDPEALKEIRESITHLSGVMAMASLVGWHAVSNVASKEEAMMQMTPMIGALNKAINDSIAYLSVRDAAKH